MRTKHKDGGWNYNGLDTLTNEQAMLMVLVDIRDELKQIKTWCGMAKDEAQKQTRYLRRIDARLAKDLPLPRGKKYE